MTIPLESLQTVINKLAVILNKSPKTHASGVSDIYILDQNSLNGFVTEVAWVKIIERRLDS